MLIISEIDDCLSLDTYEEGEKAIHPPLPVFRCVRLPDCWKVLLKYFNLYTLDNCSLFSASCDL